MTQLTAQGTDAIFHSDVSQLGPADDREAEEGDSISMNAAETASRLANKLRSSVEGVEFKFDSRTPEDIDFKIQNLPTGKIIVSPFEERFVFVQTLLNLAHPALSECDPTELHLLANYENMTLRGATILCSSTQPTLLLRAGYAGAKGKTMDELANTVNDVFNLCDLYQLLWHRVSAASESGKFSFSHYLANRKKEQGENSHQVLSVQDLFSGDPQEVFSGLLHFVTVDLCWKVEVLSDQIARVWCPHFSASILLQIPEGEPILTASVPVALFEKMEDVIPMVQSLNFSVPYGHFTPMPGPEGKTALEYHVHKYMTDDLRMYHFQLLFRMLEFGAQSLGDLLKRAEAA